MSLRDAARKGAFYGTLLQFAMVLSGHFVPVIKLYGFAIGGMAISFAAGVIFARNARAARGMSALGGAIVGGLGAVLGIAVSYALGDVPAFVFIVGTTSSLTTGAIGGAIAGGK